MYTGRCDTGGFGYLADHLYDRHRARLYAAVTGSGRAGVCCRLSVADASFKGDSDRGGTGDVLWCNAWLFVGGTDGYL